MTRLLTVEEVAERLGVTKDWVWAQARAGRIPHVQLGRFGTRMAAAGTPLRTLQGWMGHRDYKTTEIYADFAPDPTQGAVWAQRAFGEVPTQPTAEADATRHWPVDGLL